MLTIYFSFSFVNVCVMVWHNNFCTTESKSHKDKGEQLNDQPISSKSNKGGRDDRIKSILLWNSPHRPETLIFGAGRKVFQQHGCEFSNCELVISRRPLFHDFAVDSYDAIVFNIIDDYWTAKLPKPYQRKKNQRYVFFTQESPSALKNYDDVVYKAKFNWTMTYRKNSDIQLFYGRITPKASKVQLWPENNKALLVPTLQRNFTANKTKLVAWMASKCVTHSRREDYVKELRKHLQVDIYGECGKLSCSQHDLVFSHPKCYDMLEYNYKFYLSFENSICEDYVTEKFFNIISRNIVPVVFGGADYSRIAPPHSYIDARKYEPDQLAAYLKILDANDTLYNEYFWWKEYYTVEAGVGQMARRGFCDLCKKLHQDQHYKSYSGRTLLSQWTTRLACPQQIHGLFN